MKNKPRSLKKKKEDRWDETSAARQKFLDNYGVENLRSVYRFTL